MALAIPWEGRPAAAETGSERTSSPLHVRVWEEVAVPVAFHAAGTCLEPEVRLVDGEAEVAIPVVVRVTAEAEGCDEPPEVVLRLVLTARVPPGQAFTAVQRLQMALPLHIGAGLTAEVEDVRSLSARRLAGGTVKASAANHP